MRQRVPGSQELACSALTYGNVSQPPTSTIAKRQREGTVTSLAVFFDMALNINISKRKRKRVQRDGGVKHQIRHVVSWHSECR